MDDMIAADSLIFIDSAHSAEIETVTIWDPPAEAEAAAVSRSVQVFRENAPDPMSPGKRNMELSIYLARHETRGRTSVTQGSTRVKIGTYRGDDPVEHTVAAIEAEDAGGWFLRLS
jgi:hypothetical protein